MKNKKQIVIQTIGLAMLANMFGKGRFATVTFKKADGSSRMLNGKTLVHKAINGNGASYDASTKNQLRVFDVNIKDKNTGERVGGYRTVTVDRVTDVRSNGIIYKVARDPREGSFINNIVGNELGVNVDVSGVSYTYHGVPAVIVNQWKNAESKGTYYNERIKPYYAFTRNG